MAEQVGARRASLLGAAVLCEASWPRDAGASDDEMVKQVCRLLRVSHWWGLLASIYHVSLCQSLHAADLCTALTKLLFGVLVQAATAYSALTGKSWVFELRAIHIAGSAAQIALALSIHASNVEWTTHDVAVMLVTHPLLSFVIVCGRSVLDSWCNAEPPKMLVLTCAVLNLSVMCKVAFAIPSLTGVVQMFVITWIVVQNFMNILLMKVRNALRKERDALKLARDGLQQHVDSQDSMWRSVFDATLICDPTSCIVSASAHAVDLLQFEAAGALLGRSFCGLAAPSEQSRISRFLKEVVSSPSSQAMTIQGTFLQKERAPVELQINAVRIAQTEGAFGILIGARLVEAPKEERPAGPPEDRSPKAGVAEGPDCPGSEDMWIAFDAGTENFAITDCSPGLLFEGEKLGFLNWVPPMARDGLEDWVVDEVATCGELGSTSSSVIERLHLRMPAAPARSIVAEKAWLEVMPTEVDDEELLSLPAVLWLRGVTCQQRRRSSDAKRQARPARPVKQQRLTSILEDARQELSSILEELAERQSVELSEQQSVTSDELTPSDSVSEHGVKFRIRARSEGGVDSFGTLAELETAAGSEELTPSSEELTPSDSTSDSTSKLNGVRLRRRG